MRGITCRGFVGGGPVEDMETEERAELGARLTARMGRAMDDRFTAAPEEYAKALHRGDRHRCGVATHRPQRKGRARNRNAKA